MKKPGINVYFHTDFSLCRSAFKAVITLIHLSSSRAQRQT